MAESIKEKKSRLDRIHKVQNTLQNMHQELKLHYPKIHNEDILFFAYIYYPVALVDVTMVERTFEDMNAIEAAVLSFLKLGLNAKEIALMTGMHENTVDSVLLFLRGSGQIGDSGLTGIGELSLEKGQRVTDHKVVQQFQLDPVGLRFLRIHDTVNTSKLQRKQSVQEEQALKIDYFDLAERSRLENQLKDQYTEIAWHNKDVLNANVERIEEIVCKEVQYVPACMVGLSGCDTPLVFAYRYDKSNSIKNSKDRLGFKPFAAPPGIVARYELPVDTPDVMEGNSFIQDVKQLFDEATQRKPNPKNIYDRPFYERAIMDELIGKRHLDKEQFLPIENNFRGMGFFFALHEDTVLEVSQGLVYILKEIANEGTCQFVHISLCGRVVNLLPDEAVRARAVAMQKLVNSKLEGDWGKAAKYIQYHVQGIGSDIWNGMLQALEEYTEKDEPM